MKTHYGMWLVMALCFTVLGMLYRGQQDIIAQQKFNEDVSMILRDISLKQLTNINI